MSIKKECLMITHLRIFLELILIKYAHGFHDDKSSPFVRENNEICARLANNPLEDLKCYR